MWHFSSLKTSQYALALFNHLHPSLESPSYHCCGYPRTPFLESNSEPLDRPSWVSTHFPSQYKEQEEESLLEGSWEASVQNYSAEGRLCPGRWQINPLFNMPDAFLPRSIALAWLLVIARSGCWEGVWAGAEETETHRILYTSICRTRVVCFFLPAPRSSIYRAESNYCTSWQSLCCHWSALELSALHHHFKKEHVLRNLCKLGKNDPWMVACSPGEGDLESGILRGWQSGQRHITWVPVEASVGLARSTRL